MSKVYEIKINKHKTIIWKLNGELHSLKDLPALIYADGSKSWFQHGEIHRDGDNPAMIWADGTKFWRQHGKRHRLTGPAVEWENGKVEYWIEGDFLSKKQFEERIRCLKSTK